MSRQLSRFLLLLVGINFLYTLSGVLNFQIESVDVLGMWLFKAKAIYIEGGFPIQTLKDPDFLLAHPQYPLLMSGIYAGIYFMMGGIWELPILVLYPGYYLAILWLVYRVLRGFELTQLQSLTYVYVYSMFSPLLGQAGRGHAGSADILIVLLAWIVVRTLQTQTIRPSWQTLVAVVALVCFASQIKLEGLFLGAALLLIKSPLLSKLTAISLAIVPFLIWNIVLATYQIPSDFTFVFPGWSELGWRVILIGQHTLLEMINLRNWYFFWPLFGVAVLSGRKPQTAQHRSVTWLVQMLFLVSLGYVAVYLTVTTNLEAHITSSIDRVLLHLTPWFYPVFVWYSQMSLRHLVQDPASKA